MALKFNKEIKKILGKFNKEQAKMGMEVEKEHDDVTHKNRKLTAKIAAAHLEEVPDYYTKLKVVEKKNK